MQAHGGDNIGAHPVIGVIPALAHHRLRGEVHDMGKLLVLHQFFECIEIVVDVDSLEADLSGTLLPFVGQHGFVGFVRSAGGHDVMALLGQVIHEGCAGE